MTVISRPFLSLTVLPCLWGFLGMDAIATGQEKVAGKVAEAAGKTQAKAKLPALYSRLGLSTEQTRKVLEIQTRYQNEIQQLQRKMTALKGDMKKEMLETLGPEQRARLEELQKMDRTRDKD